jgi:hypothetical protein
MPRLSPPVCVWKLHGCAVLGNYIFEKDRAAALARMEAGKRDFVVGGIVDKRKVENQAHLLVRWKGFDASYATWESRAKMMRVVPDMVKQFESELAKRLRKTVARQRSKFTHSQADAVLKRLAQPAHHQTSRSSKNTPAPPQGAGAPTTAQQQKPQVSRANRRATALLGCPRGTATLASPCSSTPPPHPGLHVAQRRGFQPTPLLRLHEQPAH